MLISPCNPPLARLKMSAAHAAAQTTWAEAPLTRRRLGRKRSMARDCPWKARQAPGGNVRLTGGETALSCPTNQGG